MSGNFSKVLVARNSSKNKCKVADGTPLIVKPLTDIPMKDHVAHHFVSAKDCETKSKYGWVKETDPFSLEDFIREHWCGDQPSESESRHLETLLKSIASLAPNTPCAATYSRRGIEVRRMDFTVHRVIFHEA